MELALWALVGRPESENDKIKPDPKSKNVVS